MTRGVSFLAGLVLSAAIAWPATRAAELPPVECVQALRSARAMLDRGDREAGVELLRRAVERFPDEVVPLVALWDFHRRFGLPAEEAVKLRALLTERLADPAYALPPGVLRYLISNPEADEQELQQLLAAAKARLDGTDREMLEAIALLQQRLDLPADARETYGRMLGLEPSPTLRWACVLLDIELERWADAAAGLAPIASAKQASLSSRLLYVDVLSRLGRHDELLRQLETISTGTPLVQEFINGFLLEAAWNLRDAERDTEAEGLFRRVLASDPTNEQAATAVAFLYGTAEELQQHLASKSVGRQEVEPYDLLEQAGNLLAAGDAAQAFDLLDRVSRALPDEEIAWYNLGLAALELERWDVAARAFEAAARIRPERVDSWIQHGKSLQKIGRCAEAIDVLKQALALAPERNEAYYYLYVCHAASGNHEAAEDALRRYNAR